MTDHTVKSFDVELGRLNDTLMTMGKMALDQFIIATEALAERDDSKASQVVSQDHRIDALEHEAQNQTVRLLALRQPVAADLRQIVAALKISSELERIGDYAANVAKRTLVLNQHQAVPTVDGIVNLAERVQGMLETMMVAYAESDVDKAVEVWTEDEAVDKMYTSLFRELLTYMMEDPRTITSCTHLMFMAKNIERIGDHITNMAEVLYYLVKGVPLDGDRPKGSDVWSNG